MTTRKQPFRKRTIKAVTDAELTESPYTGSRTPAQLHDDIKKKDIKLNELRKEVDSLKQENRGLSSSIAGKIQEIEDRDTKINKFVEEQWKRTRDTSNKADADDVVADNLQSIFGSVHNWAKNYSYRTKGVDAAAWNYVHSRCSASDSTFAENVSEEMSKSILQGCVPCYPLVETIVNREICQHLFESPLGFTYTSGQTGKSVGDIDWLLSLPGLGLQATYPLSVESNISTDLDVQIKLRMTVMKTLDLSRQPPESRHIPAEIPRLKKSYDDSLVTAIDTKLQPLLRLVDKDDQITRRNALESIINKASKVSQDLAAQPIELIARFRNKLGRYKYREGHRSTECHRACKLSSADSDTDADLSKKSHSLDMVIRPLIMRWDLLGTAPYIPGSERPLLKAIAWIVETPDVSKSMSPSTPGLEDDVVRIKSAVSSKMKQLSDSKIETKSMKSNDGPIRNSDDSGQIDIYSSSELSSCPPSDTGNDSDTTSRPDLSANTPCRVILHADTTSMDEVRGHIDNENHTVSLRSLSDQNTQMGGIDQEKDSPIVDEGSQKSHKRKLSETKSEGLDANDESGSKKHCKRYSPDD